MVVAAVFAISGAAALTAEGDQPKVAVVVAGQAAEQPSVVARARDIAADRGAQLRVTHTSADELGVTHMLAARATTRCSPSASIAASRSIPSPPASRTRASPRVL